MRIWWRIALFAVGLLFVAGSYDKFAEHFHWEPSADAECISLDYDDDGRGSCNDWSNYDRVSGNEPGIAAWDLLIAIPALLVAVSPGAAVGLLIKWTSKMGPYEENEARDNAW